MASNVPYIRPATAEDMPVLERVLGARQVRFYRNRLHRRGVVLTAWVKGEPAAALYLSWEPADEPEVRRHLPDVPMLYRLHVRWDLRNRRIGTALLTAAEELARRNGHRRVAFGVDPGNSRAAGLYERLGYTEWAHGEVDTYQEIYQPGGDLTNVPDRCRIFVKHLG